MTGPYAPRLKIATSVGALIAAGGFALAMSGLGISGFLVAIVIGTPISLLLEQRAEARRRGPPATGV